MLNMLIPLSEALSVDLKSYSESLTADNENRIETERKQVRELDAQIQHLNHELATNPELQTDRSENMPYQIARDTRDMKLGVYNRKLTKIAAMEKNTYADYTPIGTVILGTTVVLRILKIQSYDSLNFLRKYNPSAKDIPDTSIFKLVTDDVSDAKAHYISEDSIIGKLVKGKTEGSTFTAVTNFGNINYKIERIY